MAQFIPFDPQVEVYGASMASVVVSMGDEIQPILAAHGLANYDPERWYPQSAWLNVLYDIEASGINAMFNFVSIGMKIPEHAVFPPEINSLPDALASIDVAYHMNHRGGEIGHYHAEVVDDNHIAVHCENPYPCDFDYGIIYAVARRFRPAGTHFVVKHEEFGTCRKHGDRSCTYHVTLKRG